MKRHPYQIVHDNNTSNNVIGEWSPNFFLEKKDKREDTKLTEYIEF